MSLFLNQVHCYRLFGVHFRNIWINCSKTHQAKYCFYLDCTFFWKTHNFCNQANSDKSSFQNLEMGSFYSNLPMCMSHSRNRFAGERSVPELDCLLLVTNLLWCLFLRCTGCVPNVLLLILSKSHVLKISVYCPRIWYSY